ncbi:hypothetical protein DICPUDRAFT_154027 [Dictyostelium purpureum]|uniref:Amino acid permease/ SLC12A domain-containing protein n=1 Tax=Dictyostelium purpureum TaxID=5786 RepID=F0ZQD0_DICPU|nr:uncharacterized protein DICPUDRAFT_154027 [Dictyostelium purpureum]EGC33847.1 hypothetical protein DICPUDRAFT_154027 [Dictyostelium purpureum]|eukprot:XP_003289637.1 hypothetical protein DICPUDRAFT_154027 [Dictyostelium purpureum]
MGRSESDPLLEFMYPGHGSSSILDIGQGENGIVGSSSNGNNSFNSLTYQNISENSPLIRNNNSANSLVDHNYNSPLSSTSSSCGKSEILVGTTNEKMDLTGTEEAKVKKIGGSGEHKIGQLFATAICGNDITSSIFYTASSCTLSAGKYAPISLSIVCLVLYLFRKIYGEVGSALPLNGGAYNVLLNTTSKQFASVAAALTMISYVATAVVSGSSAMGYLHSLWEGLDVFWATIILLGFFALLNLMGITESAVVAFIIFVIHMVTLCILVFGGFGLYFYKHDWTILINNYQDVNPDIPIGPDQLPCDRQFYWGQDFAYCIYFGFGSAMLGVTGFETSSNFIEQQKKGVFPKTLRNMWAIVTFFNPLIGVLALCYLPTCSIANANSDVLAQLADRIFGKWFHYWIIIDAVLVLSGSVLTSYVGFVGLVRRMALDRCLPQFLINVNPLRKTCHWIIILFFLICSSLFAIVKGQTSTLEGVYAVSFLGVMGLFAIGNMLLKYKRSSLRREIKSPWIGVLLGLVAVFLGLIANIIRNTSIMFYFGIYFSITIFVIMVMFTRARLLKVVLFFSQIVIWWSPQLKARVARSIGDSIKKINSQPIVFFAAKDDTAYLNKAILYIRDNEQTNWVKIIHCYDDQGESIDNFSQNVEFLDGCYPKIRIDFIKVFADFTPSTVEKISIILGVPKNFMFIACPKEHTGSMVIPLSLGDFGGVRCITH